MQHCGQHLSSMDNICPHCLLTLSPQLEYFVRKELPLQFCLPAFPAKSANRNKTLGGLPDLGEELALQRLHDFCENMFRYYAPGAKLIICSDGHVFNELVLVASAQVDAYQVILQNIVKKTALSTLSFFDLRQAENQGLMLKDYLLPIDYIKNDIKTNADERQMFNGLHRFMFEDFLALIDGKSRNQIKGLAKEKTYEVIQHSHAWSELVRTAFPHAIRLSIHPHSCTTGKLSMQLLPAQDQWATPWHNVVVMDQNRQPTLMKRYQAENLSARVIQYEGRDYYYAL